MRAAHSFPCKTCDTKFCKLTELDKHQTENHPYMCVICFTDLGNKEGLGKHIEDIHTYTCDVCGYIAISEDVMENHILEKHARPDSDGKYRCDDCDFLTDEKSVFGKHFKDVHGSKANKDGHSRTKPTEEMRILQHNFERLEIMYQDSLEEVNNVESEYEARLIKANDNYIVVKAENEVLKEKVDVLFKLGRSYINNSVKQRSTDQVDTQSQEKDDVVEEEI